MLELSKRVINKDQIRVGQVLKINYNKSDGSSTTDTILVVDPNATAVSNINAKDGGVGQGRKNKLHAIKLKNLSPEDTLKLITTVRTFKRAGGKQIYDLFKSSEYSIGTDNYRTYTPGNVTTVEEIEVAQTAPGTMRVKVGNSVLYGVAHGEYVTANIKDYPRLIREIKNCNYQIFYEGVTDVKPEPVVMELFKILHAFDSTFDISQLKYASWDINMESGQDAFRTILPLFGPTFEKDGQGIFPNVQRKLIDKKIKLTGSETLMQVLLMSGGQGGWIQNASETNIRKIISMARENTQAELNAYLNRPYTKDNFEKFHAIGQKYAFADYEDDLGEYYKTADITRLQIVANKKRDQRLFNFMTNSIGVYFAGYGHLEMIEAIKNIKGGK
jgi:hypothetical protein